MHSAINSGRLQVGRQMETLGADWAVGEGVEKVNTGVSFLIR